MIGNVRGEIWLGDEDEEDGGTVEDDYARVAGVEAAGVLTTDNLIHSRVLPPARRQGRRRGILCAGRSRCALLRCESGDGGVLELARRRL